VTAAGPDGAGDHSLLAAWDPIPGWEIDDRRCILGGTDNPIKPDRSGRIDRGIGSPR